MWPGFAFLLFQYPDERQYSLEISSLICEIDTFLDWHIENAFIAALILIKQLSRIFCLCFWYK